MRRINKVFNADNNELKIVYRNESNLVRTQLDNQFTGFFREKELKTITQYEKQLYPLIQEIVSIDLLCLRKMDTDEEIYANFIQNNNIIERIKYAYNIDDETMNANFENLPIKAKKAIELFFNLDDSFASIDEILEILNTDNDGLCRLIKINLRSLYINHGAKEKYEPRPTKKGVFFVPTYFFEYFEENGFSREDIECAFSSYDEDIKNTIKKLYGVTLTNRKNTVTKLDTNDILNLKTVFLDSKNSINNIIKREQESFTIPEYSGNINEFNLIKYYASLGFKVDVFLESIKNISPLRKRSISMVFDQQYNIKTNRILKIKRLLENHEKGHLYSFIFSKDEGLQKDMLLRLEQQKNKFCNEDGYIKNIYEYYEKLGFSKERITFALKQIPADTLLLISKYYDESFNLKENYQKNSFLRQTVISTFVNPDSIFCLALFNNTSVKLKYDDSVREDVYQNYYIYFGLRGIFGNYVKRGISLLTPQEKRILEKYYSHGGNLKEKAEVTDELINILNKVIYNTINYKEIKEKSRYEKLEDVANIFIELGCIEESIKHVLESLDEAYLDKLIGMSKSNCVKDEIILEYIKIIVKCEYLDKLINLKDLIIYLGFTEEEANAIIYLIQSDKENFDLSKYFDITTFNLKESVINDRCAEEELQNRIDYYITLYIHKRKDDSKIVNLINLENTYHSFLSELNKKRKEEMLEISPTRSSMCKKFGGRNINYYILASGTLTNYTFSSVTELLIYTKLFNNALRIYNGPQKKYEKKK